MSAESPNEFDNLLVVNVGVERNKALLEPANDIYLQHKSRLFRADVCATHLFVGTTGKDADGTGKDVDGDRGLIPEIIRIAAGAQKDQDEKLGHKGYDAHDTYILEGKDAYEFLLRMAVGLNDKPMFNPHIVNQLRKRWEKFVTEDAANTPENIARLTKVMDCLISLTDDMTKSLTRGDVADIRKVIINNDKQPYLIPSREMVTRRLTHFHKGNTVMIIAGDDDPMGDNNTKNMARVLHDAKRIIITHPNPAMARQHANVLNNLRKPKDVLQNVEEIVAMPFEQAVANGFSPTVEPPVTQVYISNIQHQHRDRLIAESKVAIARDPSLYIAMRKSDGTGKNIPEWQALKHELESTGSDDRLVLAEDVNRAVKEQEVTNKLVEARVKHACDYVAQARIRGLGTDWQGKIAPGQIEQVVKLALQDTELSPAELEKEFVAIEQKAKNSLARWHQRAGGGGQGGAGGPPHI